MEVVQVRQQTADVKSVRIRFRDEARAATFSFRVGQFGIFSAFGAGESHVQYLLQFELAGLHRVLFPPHGPRDRGPVEDRRGRHLGFRGPYGNGYPMDEWKGHDLIFLGGGIAMPPIRCAVWYALENRADYGRDHDRLRRAHRRRPGFADELDKWAGYDRVG